MSRPEYYVSLTGPLLGFYFPLPADLASDNERRVALNTSKLARLWCNIYTRAEAEQAVQRHGGTLIAEGYARLLDYDSHAVFEQRRHE